MDMRDVGGHPGQLLVGILFEQDPEQLRGVNGRNRTKWHRQREQV
jgi:hypothetical protein